MVRVHLNTFRISKEAKKNSFRMFDFSESSLEISKTGYVYLILGALVTWLIFIRLSVYVQIADIHAKKNHDDDLEMVESIVSPRNNVASDRPRYVFIDLVRGLAISFVVVFHLIWNLRHNEILSHEPRIRGHVLFREMCEFWVFFGVSFLLLAELFAVSMTAGYAGFTCVTFFCIIWHYWASQACGVGMIMFCVGISSYVQNTPQIQYIKIFFRLKKLIAVSACISLVTYIVLPNEFIYFGAIHCITTVSILHLPFLRLPAIIGVLFIFTYKGFIGDFPLEVPVFRDTVDHMPWFENLGYLLLGVFSGQFFSVQHSKTYSRYLSNGPGILLGQTVFPFIGRHSLLIFIAHQIVLFPVIALLRKVY